MKRAEQIRSAAKVSRIAVLNHPIQCFAPLDGYLNTAPDLEVTALYLSDFSIRGGRDCGFRRDVKWDLDLLNGYRSVFLGDAAHARAAQQVWNEARSLWGPGIDLERYPGLQRALFGQLAAADGQPLPRPQPIKPQAANCQRSQRFCTSF